MLSITVEEFADQIILHCHGKLVHGHEAEMLCVALRQKRTVLTLDFSKVDMIDAGGIGALVSLVAAGIYLEVVAPAPDIRTVLSLTHLDTILNIRDSEDSDFVRYGTPTNVVNVTCESAISAANMRL